MSARLRSRRSILVKLEGFARTSRLVQLRALTSLKVLRSILVKLEVVVVIPQLARESGSQSVGHRVRRALCFVP